MPTKVIQLYQPIGELDFFSPDCMSAEMFAEEMRGAMGHDIELRISSPGGEVSHGFTMAALLKSHVGKKTAIIDGFCASAATFPALACDEVHMNELSMFMIHRSSAGARGHADDLEDAASVLSSLDALAAAEYERKSGQSKETVAGWMARNTWFTPTEALAAGLCGKILTGANPAAAAKATAQSMKFYMRAGSIPESVRAFLNPPAAAPPKAPPAASVPPSGAKKMKSTPITRGLVFALSAMASAVAQAQASSDPEEKTLGDQMSTDYTAAQAQLAEVTDAPNPEEMQRVHAKVAEMAGTNEGLVGFVEGLKAAADAKGQTAMAERMVQVDALLAAAVNPPKGQPRKLSPLQAAAQRAAYTKDESRTVADLKMYLKLSPTLPALNVTEDQSAKTATGSLDGDDADVADEKFDAEFRKHAMGGKVTQ